MGPRRSTTLSVLVHVLEAIDRLGLRYHIGGSFASAIHGVPRQTMDADLVVELDIGSVVELVDGLEDEFYVDVDGARDAVKRRRSFNAIHLETGFKVDFFVKGRGAFDELELERSVLMQITADPPRSAFVKTAEDTVLRKLQWYRSGGEVSDRQWRDVLGVLMAVGEELDREYLHHWARRLGVSDLLERAEGETGPLPPV
jgi:hypothetical protein